MRKAKIAALAAGLALMLGACAAPASEGPREGNGSTPQTVMVFDVQTSSGTVECIYVKNGFGGGLSCNW